MISPFPRGSLDHCEQPEFNTGKPCTSCAAYHYQCDICAANCTAGAPYGPCTREMDGTHRCYRCQKNWERYAGAATPHSQLDVLAIHAALAYLVAQDSDVVQHEGVNVVERAREILAALETAAHTPSGLGGRR